ncbi:MAG: hypothetical protein GX181_00920 [Synergistaceae bacterium]|nr:DUF364 domain-containing protein [Synergistota bacterium]NLM70506.1 hypothetical protein [Synergistaceae bacterium]
MRLYDSILEFSLTAPKCAVEEFVVGWRGSFLRLADGRWGVGSTPRTEDEPLSTREDHTKNLLSLDSHGLASLVVSPYPQEFASASASLSAIVPSPSSGSSLDHLSSVLSGEKVFVFAPEPCVVDTLRDWNCDISIFDDKNRGRRSYPVWASSQYLGSGGWLWLGPDSLRDRRILTLEPFFRSCQGVILHGPGIPFIPSVFKAFGVTHLITTVSTGSDMSTVKRYISAGGSPWMCPSLIWRFFSLLYMEGKAK